jgi:hypothetical protein
MKDEPDKSHGIVPGAPRAFLTQPPIFILHS